MKQTKIIHCLTFLFSAAALAGCSEIETPTGYEALTRPLGTAAPFHRGTTKDEVLSDWGSPDRILPLGVDELGNRREEWVYRGRLPAVPIDYGYVSHTKRLFFEGENLTRWESERPESTQITPDDSSGY